MEWVEGMDWITVWSCAHRCTIYTHWENQNKFNLIIPCYIEGEALRLKYSNQYNNKSIIIEHIVISLMNDTGIEENMNIRSQAVQVSSQQDRYSDTFFFKIIPPINIKIEMSFSTYENPMSGNTFDGYVVMILQRIDILTRKMCRVLACFGDSLTHQGNWTKPFFQRIYAKCTDSISAFELGINGNRLLRDSHDYNNTMGLSGFERFSHDILEICGLTHVILALGINDIALPGTAKTGMDEFPDLEAIKEAFVCMAKWAHEIGATVIGATIMPCNWNGGYEFLREDMRLKVNNWIKKTEIFDGVLDFSGILSVDGKSGLRPEYDSGDGLHINQKAGMELQKKIPIEYFL